MKRILFAIALIVVTITGYAQEIRHVRGVKAVEVGAGISGMTKQFNASYLWYHSSSLYFKGTAFHMLGEDSGLEFTSTGVDFGPLFTLTNLNEITYFNVGGGVTASVDQLNPAIKVFDSEGNVSENNYSTFKFGFVGKVETETFLSNKFVLVVGANYKFLLGENFGNTRWAATAGLRFNF